ncbi:MAG TPA: hypothetical protein VI915_06295 [Thermoplasmata archaeon]|nr:hypothetical protein [Thermoplasmata archaeon]
MRAPSAALVAVLIVAGLPLVVLPTPRGPEAPEAGPALASLGNAFVANVGQIPDPGIRFVGSAPRLAIGFAESAVLLHVVAPGPPAAHLRVTFPGARATSPRGAEALPDVVHSFLGRDPAAWRTHVPAFREVRYDGLYAGVDLAYRLGPGGLKYAFVVAPGADPGAIRIAYEGAIDVRLEAGDLVVSTAAGGLRDTAPAAWQGADLVRCAFAPAGPAAVRFSCTGRDPTRALTIDPLVFATFLGGAGRDESRAIAVGPSGDAYVTGVTASLDFPATPGAVGTQPRGGSDVFVARLSENGTRLVYATFLGGRDEEEGYAIAVDAAGRATVTGYTLSPDFPIVPPALDPDFAGGDAFVLRLGPEGDTLEAATLLGGSNFDEALGVALDPDGAAYVVGETLSPDFPTTPGAFDRTDHGGWDGFVAKIDAAAARLVYGTYLGGVFSDAVNAVAVGPDGVAVVAGMTLSTDFPTTASPFQSRLQGDRDAFVARVLPDGSGLVSSTYIGGAGVDEARAVLLDAAGRAHVAGVTDSRAFPVTAGCFDPTPEGGEDAFYLVLEAVGDAVAYSTYLGGLGLDEARALALHPAGGVVLAGTTDSPDFPTTRGALDASLGDPRDAFVAWLGGPGPALTYASFLGGPGPDTGYAIAVDAEGHAFVAGVAGGAEFPSTPGAADPTWNGDLDGYVVRIDLAPEPDTAAQLLGLFVVFVVGVAVPLAFLWYARRRRGDEPPPPGRPA